MSCCLPLDCFYSNFTRFQHANFNVQNMYIATTSPLSSIQISPDKSHGISHQADYCIISIIITSRDNAPHMYLNPNMPISFFPQAVSRLVSLSKENRFYSCAMHSYWPCQHTVILSSEHGRISYDMLWRASQFKAIGNMIWHACVLVLISYCKKVYVHFDTLECQVGTRRVYEYNIDRKQENVVSV